MPPKKRAAAGAEPLPGLAPKANLADIKDMLWKAADKLRGSMDASQYKDFVLSLVFLKYVNDAFDECQDEVREELKAEGLGEEDIAEELEEVDYYISKGVFWVPVEARWSTLVEQMTPETIGRRLDDAMGEIMKSNKSLSGVLAKIFNRDNVDTRRLKELVDLINNTKFTGHGKAARDVLGEVYEYFLDKFAKAEGKRGGEFYTPGSVVKTLVEMIEPYEGRIYDPACGSGGMFVQAERFVEAHQGRRDSLAVYGQELNERTWRLAKMNLAIHGIWGDLSSRWADTFHDDRHPDLRFDYIMANPPFNLKDWYRDEHDRRWRYGVPPVRNANYAWMQHILYKLSENGTAGVVMANGSMTSNTSGEGDIRRAMLEADVVSCMVALPGQLFRTTQIPACLWIFTKDKSAKSGRTDRQGRVLFIDARELGVMADRTERVFPDEDIFKIADAYRAWRGTKSAQEENLEYSDEAGFCYSASLEEIAKNDYVLTPGRYVGTTEKEKDDGEPIREKIDRLTKDLFANFEESAKLEQEVRTQIGRIDGR
ncbi:type I restriction-modification system subunit M [Glycomyces arizonensis]|uniref:class I SAM-dependent DNA methyltransferase n=1 Tax=Glycomyces arizonensis TaxID=256035 RepID=UPI00040F1547|nr:class I SAM-dependent DNA methyltransferase [Glycomyces arizonensis]